MDSATTKTVLFLCTGNYYRSRYAEHYFNGLATQRGLSWRAISRGLYLSDANLGPMSTYSLARLRRHGFAPPPLLRYPRDVEEQELAQADLIVAVKEAEHRPMMRVRFPQWTERVRYWSIHDLDVADHETGLASLEDAVLNLLDEIAKQETDAEEE